MLQVERKRGPWAEQVLVEMDRAGLDRTELAVETGIAEARLDAILDGGDAPRLLDRRAMDRVLHERLGGSP